MSQDIARIYKIVIHFNREENTLYILARQSQEGTYDEITLCIISLIIGEGKVKDVTKFIKEPELQNFINKHYDKDLSSFSLNLLIHLNPKL